MLKTIIIALMAMTLTGCASQEAFDLINMILLMIVILLLAPQTIKNFKE